MKTHGGGPLTSFRLNREPETRVRLTDGAHEYIGDLAEQVSYDQCEYPLIELTGGAVYVTMQGATWHFTEARTSGSASASALDGAILAPMPGKVIAVDVAKGEAVTKGQRLLVLEAMKMEHALTAPFDGTVAELKASEGQQVQVEALLAKVEKAED